MIYLFIGTIVLVAIGVTFFIIGDSGYEFRHSVIQFVGVIACLAGFFGVIVTTIAGMEWYGSDVKAKLINREYGTDYTQAEVFYASSVIDLIRELDRKRIEVNGDFRRERDPQRDKYPRKDGK